MERNIQINWAEIVQEARRQRKAQGLSQRRLAGLAKVSPPTVSRFEQNRQDIQLSSALAILKVLGMTERKHEGSLLLRRNTASSQGSQPGYTVMFAPYEGAGGALEPKSFPDEESLRAFLNELDIASDIQRLALASLVQQKSATIPDVLLTGLQIKQYWPKQKLR